jgi:membrane peptidoglycan carboxypeptidase
VANRDYGLNLEAGQTSYALPSNVQGFGAGSIYKIFTAAAAMERGLGINSMVPVTDSYTSRVFSNGSAPYTVRNAGNYRSGSITLQSALATSPNTTFVALEDRIGSLDPVVEMAWRLGMRESLSAPDSSGGTWCPPTPIDAMFDRDGHPVLVPEAPCEQAVPEGLANSLAVGLSKDDQPGGTSFAAAQNANWTRPMIGKTGTTQNNRSAGFVGATPQYSAAVLVWPDGSRPSPICDTDPPRLCGDGNIFGGKVPARTWFQAMIPLHQGLPVLPLPPTEPRYVDGDVGVPVPNVVGEGENQARLILERAGFKVITARTESNQAAGTVVSQVPTRGALPGDTITLYVSTGSAPPTPTRRPTTPAGQPRPPEPTEEPEAFQPPELTGIPRPQPPEEPTETTTPEPEEPTATEEPPTEPSPEEPGG